VVQLLHGAFLRRKTMGMYDEIYIDFQLPEIKRKPPYTLQTKDFYCNLDTYTIQNNRLILKYVEWEETPKEELKYPEFPLFGSIRKKEGSEKDIDQNYHGIFDGCEVDDDGTLFYFIFKFTDGNMTEVYVQSKH